MEVTKTIPAYNPADANSLDGLNNIMLDKFAMGIECVIPGIVQSYDKATNRATIKPAITGVASQGQKVSKPAYTNIPVLQLGGGASISFPIKQGNTGWLIACDRNISIFKQNLTESAPNDLRKHKFEDSFFIPDSINGQGTDDVVIKNNSQVLTVSDEDITATNFKALNGATGSFISQDNKTITVTNGIITGIS